MKVLFKNKTKYTKQLYSDFLKFHVKKFGFTTDLYTLTICLLILFCLIIQIKNHNYPLIFLFIVAFFAFIIYRIFHPISLVKKEVQSPKIAKETIFTFTFYDKYLKCSDLKTYYKISYFKLFKVYETNQFFYLYTDKTHSFLLDKSNFVIGNSEDFSTFIKKKCRFKYKKVDFLP